VVRPFGRLGENISVREFDQGALQFHHGIQAEELVGSGIDADGDGIANEATVGEVSVLHIFQVTLPHPRQEANVTNTVDVGETRFNDLGCANCHIPQLETESEYLRLGFPEVATDPFANEYFSVNLTRPSPGFDSNGNGGVVVPLYADLKHHDMGPGLAEPSGNSVFTTARLWGVGDTAPYLHDGRAPDIHTAIMYHGGEAAGARANYEALTKSEQYEVLEFLRSLRGPVNPNRGLYGM
jgi:hypothetical protein